MKEEKDKSFFLSFINRVKYKYWIRGPILGIAILIVYLYKGINVFIDKQNESSNRIMFITTDLIEIIDTNKINKFSYHFDSDYFDSLNVLNAVKFIRNNLVEEGLKVEQIGEFKKFNKLLDREEFFYKYKVNSARDSIVIITDEFGIITSIDKFNKKITSSSLKNEIWSRHN